LRNAISAKSPPFCAHYKNPQKKLEERILAMKQSDRVAIENNLREFFRVIVELDKRATYMDMLNESKSPSEVASAHQKNLLSIQEARVYLEKIHNSWLYGEEFFSKAKKLVDICEQNYRHIYDWYEYLMSRPNVLGDPKELQKYKDYEKRNREFGAQVQNAYTQAAETLERLWS
jgi:hypothetical protein